MLALKRRQNVRLMNAKKWSWNITKKNNFKLNVSMQIIFIQAKSPLKSIRTLCMLVNKAFNRIQIFMKIRIFIKFGNTFKLALHSK